ncbi:hypothetical protein F441_09925 [Phytophthora nicotianae CJ01A1]|uniref:Uncharacterized protein n=6 Tax=Phytophthora nicotianae TaxID=4792 RepID=W2R7J9_PHYN3|nr:hypothetical protein PPTG_21062 [Phytophthora nicotianae INRA-310]ETI45483.1 hypothetical protein F443_09976 [Phytophthora nicotianae P1569]ETK85428.1 hypothetical protein L915_09778 [Phytophthora nicotianae]ETO74121.1 hypothetical protein F444_10072 [Phytophthora nicotianae P1976]ETP15287.1 hypothetical protein F441_09925 [Phytophthora nicotianae CJ01A1]ETP43343.1 hypothetical protein F442_09881 [Phytophthora nicotianae P10297]
MGMSEMGAGPIHKISLNDSVTRMRSRISPPVTVRNSRNASHHYASTASCASASDDFFHSFQDSRFNFIVCANSRDLNTTN